MYDWQYIRGLYESGQTPYQIAKRPDMPSKEGIRKRAKSEQWQRPDTENRLPIVAEALSVNSHLLTDDVLRVVLDMIASGATLEIACAAAGISARTWSLWQQQDNRLRDAVRRARAGKLVSWMSHVDKAAERDWRAGQWLLQTAPETREQYARSQSDSRLEVTINIDRSG